MSYEFEVRAVPAQPVLYMEATCAHSELGQTFMRLLPAVGKYMREQDQSMAGPPFARYIDWRESDCDVEAGVPTASLLPSTEAVKAGHLGGCQAVATLHTGPYETLPQAHAAARAWIAANGKTMAGAPWESYVNDPGDFPDPKDWQTEVFWPIE